MRVVRRYGFTYSKPLLAREVPRRCFCTVLLPALGGHRVPFSGAWVVEDEEK